MEGLFIAGVGNEGKNALSILKNKNIQILGIVDNNPDLWETEYDGIGITSPSSVIQSKENINKQVYICIGDRKRASEFAKQLFGLGFLNVFLYKYKSDWAIKLELVNGIIECNYDGTRPTFEYLETHVMNGCNLKCKGCSHFSNICNTDDAVEWNTFTQDLRQLSKICSINKLRLLGGEPFLNKELDKYIRIARECFPKTDLRLVSNGILIPTSEEKIINAIKGYDVKIDISTYHPTIKMKDRISNYLDSKEIYYEFIPDRIDYFSRCLTTNNNHDGKESQKKCGQSKCTILRNGKLYKCPMAAYIDVYNSHFCSEYRSEDHINIYGDVSGLCEFADVGNRMPIDLCKYCTTEIEVFSWENQNKVEKSDWLVEE